MADSLAWMSVFLLFCLLAQSEAHRKKLEAKLDALGRRLAAISDHLGLKPDESIPPEVVALLQAGRKIEAIVAYRKATGAGLAEAKAAVERIATDRLDSGGTILRP